MSGTVLLTGATGFVGSQVLAQLAAGGISVRAVMRPGRAGPAAVQDVVFSADLFAEDAVWWAKACAGITTVIHCAWYAKPGEYLHSPQNLSCLAGTLAMADGAMRAGVKRFVGIGTCFEYDLSAGVLSLDTPLRPTTPYAAAKAAAFLVLSQILPHAGLTFAWCRLFYLFGEGEDPKRLAAHLHARLSAGETVELTSGRQIRDFLDVTEAGRRIALTALGPIEGPVNICSGQPVSVRQFAESIADRYGRRDLLNFGARPDNAVDPPCVLGIPTILPDQSEKTEARPRATTRSRAAI